MKKVPLIFIILFYVHPIFAQSVKEIEDSMLYYLSKLQQYSYYYSNGDSDSLNLYNDCLQSYLKTALSKQPFALNATFERVKKLIDITSSEDKKFRIYCWDEQGGGSMHGYYSIVQYKSSNGVNAEIIHPKLGASKDAMDPGFFYPKIYEVRTKDRKVYYLTTRKGIYSGRDISVGIKAFIIENGLLNDSIKLFKTAKSILNSIDYSYDYFSNYNYKTMAENFTIHMSENNQKLYIPIVNSEKMTNKYLVYKWDGNYYVFDKNAK